MVADDQRAAARRFVERHRADRARTMARVSARSAAPAPAAAPTPATGADSDDGDSDPDPEGQGRPVLH